MDIVHVLKISSTISIMLAHVANPKSLRFDLSHKDLISNWVKRLKHMKNKIQI